MTQFCKSFSCIVLMFLWVVHSGVVQAGEEHNLVYKIISEFEVHHFKRQIDVRLEHKVTKAELRLIALEIKKTEKKKYVRTFISYKLANMEKGKDFWARTDFDPDLKVTIYGLTIKEEAKMIQEAKTISHSRDVVGIWLDDRTSCMTLKIFFREKGNLLLETKERDGSGSVEEMTQSQINAGTKIVEKGGNRHGEYYLLDSQGELHCGDREDILFLKYRKIGFDDSKGSALTAKKPSKPIIPAARIGQPGVKPPVFTKQVNPEYPKSAIKVKIQGYIVLEATFKKEGTIENIKVLRGLGKGKYGFNEAGIEALKKWEYLPGTINGLPADIILQLKIDFTLQ